jgi:hypothetical protein
VNASAWANRPTDHTARPVVPKLPLRGPTDRPRRQAGCLESDGAGPKIQERTTVTKSSFHHADPSADRHTSYLHAGLAAFSHMATLASAKAGSMSGGLPSILPLHARGRAGYLGL